MVDMYPHSFKGEISVEVEGKTYSGLYELERGVITIEVPEWGRTMSTHATSRTPSDVKIEAQRLLREIVEGDHYKK